MMLTNKDIINYLPCIKWTYTTLDKITNTEENLWNECKSYINTDFEIFRGYVISFVHTK